MALLEVGDLTPFATIDGPKALAMIADAIALAIVAAPCLAGDPGHSEAGYGLADQQVAAAKAILRGAVLRWNEAGSGATTQQVVGPFGQTVTPVARKSLFWPSEIEALRNICKTADSGGAFAVDTAAHAMQMHAVLGYGSQGGLYGFDIPPSDG